MPHIKMTNLTFDVEPLVRELYFASDAWDKIPYRTKFRGSPHREISDIWVRYNHLDNYYNNPQTFNDEHIAVWYPVVSQLPSARMMAIALADMLEADRMGAVLITKIPPGKQVYRHVDPGWHAKFYEKYVIQIRGNSRQAFRFDDEELRAETGQCYWFDNQFPHWVVNESDEDRISLIVCLRRDQCH
jgi:hypothetical protein